MALITESITVETQGIAIASISIFRIPYYSNNIVNSKIN